jgi:putative thiamine transport system substrate-binding protein
MRLLRLAAAAATLAAPLATPLAAQPDPADWDAVLAEARGQTVFWHAWGGSTTTNDFIAWLGEQAQARHGVELRHVKLSDTGEAVSRVLAEREAGRDEGGAVDLIWLNGPFFAAMKEAELLFGPFAEDLPNWALVDLDRGVQADFTVPTEGLESPWAMAQVVFIHDGARVAQPPRSAEALLDWARANPGRFTFPQPPDFLGTTFLKQMLLELAPDPARLADPVREDYDAVTAPLWAFMDGLTPLLWREGRAYPQTGPRQLQLINDGEVDIAISFSPGEATAAIASFQLPDTARTYVLDGGTLGNASFVAIPYNASAKAGAMVVANLILDPEVQLRAQDPQVLGYGTVLDMDALTEAQRAAFAALDLGPATLTPEELGTPLPEPHPSWATRLAEDWVARYGTR